MKNLVTDIFIKRALKIHGNKYNYYNVDYKNSLTKIIITCPKHGNFKQLPFNHLKGSNCPKCAQVGSLPFTTAQFIEKALKIHGNRYNYSNVIYKNNDLKVIIKCKIHGNFNQIAGEHLKGRGCSKCNGSIKENMGLEGFLERAYRVHGNKYNYSRVLYKNCYTKVIIICPEHGNFLQEPIRHLNSKGCLKCIRIDTNKFIKKSLNKHGNKYDYSNTIYKHSHHKVIIICPIHGSFKQKASHHLEGSGCKKCAGKQSKINQTLTTKQFIKKATKIHSNKYNYSKTVYKNSKSKIIIICKKHGDFNMRSSTHLEGQGCPSCRKSKGELKIENWLNNNKISFIPQARFLKCRGKKYPLPFDFYLPIHNTCIEFDGPQHHNKNMFFIKDTRLAALKFEETKLNDEIKNRYCLNNNIRLIRIKKDQIWRHTDKSLDKLLAVFKK